MNFYIDEMYWMYTVNFLESSQGWHIISRVANVSTELSVNLVDSLSLSFFRCMTKMCIYSLYQQSWAEITDFLGTLKLFGMDTKKILKKANEGKMQIISIMYSTYHQPCAKTIWVNSIFINFVWFSEQLKGFKGALSGLRQFGS